MCDDIEVVRVFAKGRNCLLAHASIAQVFACFSEIRLSQKEHSIAQHRTSVREKDEYSASRLLSKYLAMLLFGGQSTDWQVTHSDQKLPQLENCQNNIMGALSISHTHGYVAVAMCAGDLPIGVDVEKVKKRKDPRDLLVSLCYAHELAWYDAEPSLIRFYQLWTAKEAILKSHKLSIWEAMNPITELSFSEEKFNTCDSDLNLSHFQSKNADIIGAWAFAQ